MNESKSECIETDLLAFCIVCLFVSVCVLLLLLLYMFIPEGIHFVNGVYINKILTYINVCMYTGLHLYMRVCELVCICGRQCRYYLFSVFAFNHLPKSKLYKCNCISYLRQKKRHENLLLSLPLSQINLIRKNTPFQSIVLCIVYYVYNIHAYK